MSQTVSDPVRRAAAAVLAGSLVAGCLVGAAAPAFAAPEACSGIDVERPTSEVDEVEESGPPLAALQIQEAQEEVVDLSGKQPGEGVVVAVLDSGVVDAPVVPNGNAGTSPALEYFQGTAVAGLVNGAALGKGKPVGIAPAAAVVDVRVYDTGPGGRDDDSREVTTESVVAGLTLIQPRVASGDIDIVVIPLRVPASDELEAAISQVTGAGVIVVAASGDRIADDTEEGDESEEGGDDESYAYGEDYAKEVFPAGYTDDPLVVAASTLPPDGEAATDYILQSSAIDVAVPTFDAVSYAVNGSSCVLDYASTSFAAGEVAGILALLMTAYSDEAPEDIVRRLEETATGSSVDDPDRPDKLIGHGVVQPLEALTRPLSPPGAAVDPAGVRKDEAVPAALPEPEPDVLAGTRRNAIWWGLIGGGALVVAALLRPVLSRRRR